MGGTGRMPSGRRPHTLASPCGRTVGWGPRGAAPPTQGGTALRTHLSLASEIGRQPPGMRPVCYAKDRKSTTRCPSAQNCTAKTLVRTTSPECSECSSLSQHTPDATRRRAWVRAARALCERRRGGYEARSRLGLAGPRFVGPTRLVRRTRALRPGSPDPSSPPKPAATNQCSNSYNARATTFVARRKSSSTRCSSARFAFDSSTVRGPAP